MARSPLKGPASDLLAAAQGQLVQSKDADSFFDELVKKYMVYRRSVRHVIR